MSLLEATTSDAGLVDAERLAELEATIELGLDAFVRTGQALEEIRTRRLYLLTHVSFEAYLRERWNLSHPRGFALCNAAQVANALEAQGERPNGGESALRELLPVLREQGPEATARVFREVAENGELPGAPETRRRLSRRGHVQAPDRAPADLVQRYLRSIEKVVPRLDPHPKLGDVLLDYARRASVAAERLHALAEESRPPAVPPGEPCMRHGARRDERGICRDCRRPDLSHNERVGIAA
jgi:hypothetical protein